MISTTLERFYLRYDHVVLFSLLAELESKKVENQSFLNMRYLKVWRLLYAQYFFVKKLRENQLI